MRVADMTEARADAQGALGMLTEADASYDAVIAIRPTWIEPLFGKAKVAAARRDFPGAMKFVDAALAISPKSTLGLLLKGDVLLAQNDIQGAIKSYSNAVDSAPDDLGARTAVASALITAKQFDAARVHIAEVQKKAPNDPQANYLDALLSYQTGKLPQANDAIQKVSAAVPNYAAGWILAAAIQSELGQLQQAELNAQRYVGTYPNSLSARKLLATILLKSKQPAKALAVLEPVLANPALQDPEVFGLAGNALIALDDRKRASGYLEKAATLAPLNAGIQSAFGANNLASGNLDRAISSFESVLKVKADDRDADSLLIASYLAKKNYKSAAERAQSMIQRDPKDPNGYNMMGGVYLAQQNVDDARRMFQKAIDLDPAHGSAALNLTRLDLATGKSTGDAEKHLTDLLKRDPKNMDALLMLSNLEYGANRQDAGMKWLEEAVKQNPDQVQPKILLVRQLLLERQAQRALDIATAATAQSPSNTDLMALLGQAQADTGNRDAAVATYGRLAGLQPNSASVQGLIASLESADGHVSAAQSALQKALAIDPNFVGAQIALAELNTQIGNYNDAARISAALAKKPETLTAAKVITGDIAMAHRQYDEAAKNYADALAAVKTPTYVMKLHRALIGASKTKEADDLVTKWLGQHPEDLSTRLYLGSQAELAGNAKQAEVYYADVLKRDPQNIVALNQLALIYLSTKDSRAATLAERAYTVAPTRAAVGDTFGWVLVETGNLKRGQEVLEKVVKTAPNNTAARYHLAVVQSRTGDKANARSNLQQVLKTKDDFTERADAQKLLGQL